MIATRLRGTRRRGAGLDAGESRAAAAVFWLGAGLATGLVGGAVAGLLRAPARAASGQGAAAGDAPG